MASEDSQMKKLRVAFESWKEIILAVNSVLLWEKQWHPTALIGGCTALFMLLWIMDPSVLTVISLLGLSVTIGDYFIPSVAHTLFKREKWNSDKEKRLEDICANLVMFKTKVELACGSYYRMRTTNPKMYTLITGGVLALLAWLGCLFNNLFLMYLTVTFLLLFPGMEHNGLWKNGSCVPGMLSNIVKNCRYKIGEAKSGLATKKHK